MATISEVEMVRPEDMCIGPYKHGQCGCMVYWRVNLLTDSLMEKHNDSCFDLFGESTTWLRDEGRVTPTDAADMFNAGLHKIGFTVGNPLPSKKRIAELRRKMTGEETK